MKINIFMTMCALNKVKGMFVKMKKIGILLLICFLTAGCVSYTELDDLSIVSTLGIDYQEGKYQLYVQVIQGELEEQEVEKKIITYFGEGESLEKAFYTLYTKSSKRLYLSHMDLLLLTEDAINQKFSEIIHSLLANNEYRHNFHVVFLTTSLQDWMEANIPSKEVNQLIQTNQQETSTTMEKEFETMMKELLIDRNTYLPSISYQENQLSLKGYTLIENYQVKENLNLEDSLLFNFLLNKVTKAYLNNANILENQTIITTQKNKINFHFLTTLNPNQDWISNTKQQLQDFLVRYQKQEYDILKLTEKVRQNDYSYYQKQNNLLEQLHFTFTFEVRENKNYLTGDF